MTELRTIIPAGLMAAVNDVNRRRASGSVIEQRGLEMGVGRGIAQVVGEIRGQRWRIPIGVALPGPVQLSLRVGRFELDS